MHRIVLTLITVVLALATHVATARAQERPQAFVGATLITISGDDIESGVLVVQDGRIVAIGPESTELPDGAVVHDVSGKLIMPGLVDTHSHISSPFAADSSAPIQPEVRALDSVDVRDSTLAKARAGGITTANLMPGSGHLMSGQTVYIKLRDARILDDALILTDDGRIAGGMKMANGTNSMRDPPFPGTRAKSAALVRSRFVEAEAYREALAGDDPPDRDLALEALVEVLDGTRKVHHHTHRHDDIMTVLRLQREFGFRLVLQHVSEGYKVAEQIAAAGVPCSVIVIDSPGGKLEAVDMNWGNAGELEAAGVEVAFHTDDPVNDSRLFLRSAAFGVRGGMSRKGALAGVTLTGARMLDLDDRLGSLDVGKDADFIVLSGDPLSVYTHVEQTWIEGDKVFDRSDPEDRLYAVGGYGSAEPRASLNGAAALCCFGPGAGR